MVIVHARAINVVKIISVDLLLCTYRSTAPLGEIIPGGTLTVNRGVWLARP